MTQSLVPLLLLRSVDGDTGSPAATVRGRRTGHETTIPWGAAHAAEALKIKATHRGGGPPKAVEGVPV